MSRVVLPEPGLETRFSTSCCFAAKRARLRAAEAVVFIQHVDLHFQHPPLALPRGVGTRFAVAVMQVALWRAGGGEVVDFDTGDGHRLAWGGREGALRNAECGFRSSPSI